MPVLGHPRRWLGCILAGASGMCAPEGGFQWQGSADYHQMPDADAACMALLEEALAVVTLVDEHGSDAFGSN